MDAESAVRTLAIVGIGVFAIVIILSLTYQGYAQTNNQIQNTYGSSSGVFKNFTTYAGPLPNTYGSNLGLAITALVLFVVIAIIAGLFLNRKGEGVLG